LRFDSTRAKTCLAVKTENGQAYAWPSIKTVAYFVSEILFESILHRTADAKVTAAV